MVVDHHHAVHRRVDVTAVMRFGPFDPKVLLTARRHVLEADHQPVGCGEGTDRQPQVMRREILVEADRHAFAIARPHSR